MRIKIVWTAVMSAVLASLAILLSETMPNLSVALGLASIASAVLASRE